MDFFRGLGIASGVNSVHMEAGNRETGGCEVKRSLGMMPGLLLVEDSGLQAPNMKGREEEVQKK